MKNIIYTLPLLLSTGIANAQTIDWLDWTATSTSSAKSITKGRKGVALQVQSNTRTQGLTLTTAEHNAAVLRDLETKYNDLVNSGYDAAELEKMRLRIIELKQ